MRDQFIKGTIQVERAAGGYSQLRNNFSTALIVLMCMVGLVLLIACANVANLLIARAVARQKEIAVRLSVGASRGQLVRQLLVESLVLSIMGAVCGVILAIWITRLLISLIPAEGNPLLLKSAPDLRILLFTLGLTFVTSLIFGLVPALKASRPDLWTTLKDAVGTISGSGGSVLLRKGLVSVQVALSFLLLFGAGLFVRSLQNLKGTDTGFREIDSIVKFRVSPALNGYQGERAVQFYTDLLANIRTLPGVKAASYTSNQLLAGGTSDSTMSVEGHQAKDGEDMQAYMNWLSPGYFDSMGIPLLEGRDFDRRDIKRDSKVAVVNRKFAEHFFKDKSPIGRRLGWGGGPGTKLDIEIIGMVENSLYEGPRGGIRRQVFMPYYGMGTAAFYVRASGSPDSLPCRFARRGEKAGRIDAGVSDADARATARRYVAHRTSDCHAFCGLRGACYTASLDRTLRRHGICSCAPNEGDRCPHGAGRTARLGSLACHEGSSAACRNWPCSGSPRRDRAGALRFNPALWHSSTGPLGWRSRNHSTCRRSLARRLDSGAPRQPHRSPARLALRMSAGNRVQCNHKLKRELKLIMFESTL